MSEKPKPSKVHAPDEKAHWYSVFKKAGPGLVTGASDDDPSGLTTYAQAGAQFGFRYLWTSLWSLPLMIAVQEMSARIGMVTGVGMAKALLTKFPRWLVTFLVVLVVFSNTVTIGADIAGMSEALQLIIPLPFQVIAVVLTLTTVLLEIYLPYSVYAKVLKWMTISLFSYIFAAIVVKMDWSQIAWHTLVPTIHPRDVNFWYLLVALLGTTISPYLMFWQTSQEVEEEIAEGRNSIQSRRGANTAELHTMREDTVLGMSFSNLIMFFVMAVTASVLFGQGLEVHSMADAATSLRPFAGPMAEFLFAIGVFGTGMLAIPVLAGSASYALSEVLHLKEGLYRKWYQARGFYTIIAVSTLIGLGMNFLGINTVDFLVWAAAINGFVSPVLIAAILLLANSKKLMGQHVNKFWSNLGACLALIFFLVAIGGFLVTSDFTSRAIQFIQAV